MKAPVWPARLAIGLARRLGAVLIVTALGSGSCLACYTPPAHQLMGVDEQIAQARDVSLATVEGATEIGQGYLRYDLVVERRLIGPNRERFSMVVQVGSGVDNPVHSQDHSDAAFWQAGGGRLSNDTDCKVYPRFTVGERYLVFYGEPVTRRSYERIRTLNGQAARDDRWLAYVEQRLSGPWNADGIVQPPWRKQGETP